MLSLPLSALGILEVFLESSILHADSSVPQYVDETQHERALSRRVSQWLDQIPSKPLHVEDGVISHQELHREEGGHTQENEVSTRNFRLLNLLLSLFELLEFSASNELL